MERISEEGSQGMQADRIPPKQSSLRRLRFVTCAGAIVFLLVSLSLAGAYFWADGEEVESSTDVSVPPKSVSASAVTLIPEPDKSAGTNIMAIMKSDPILAVKQAFREHTFPAVAVLVGVVLMVAAIITVAILFTRMPDIPTIPEEGGETKAEEDGGQTQPTPDDAGFFSKPLTWIIGAVLLIVLVVLIAVVWRFIIKGKAPANILDTLKRETESSDDEETDDSISASVKTEVGKQLKLSDFPETYNADNLVISRNVLIKKILSLFKFVKEMASFKKAVVEPVEEPSSHICFLLFLTKIESRIPADTSFVDIFVYALQHQENLLNRDNISEGYRTTPFLLNKCGRIYQLFPIPRNRLADTEFFSLFKLVEVYNKLRSNAAEVQKLPDTKVVED